MTTLADLLPALVRVDAVLAKMASRLIADTVAIHVTAGPVTETDRRIHDAMGVGV